MSAVWWTIRPDGVIAAWEEIGWALFLILGIGAGALNLLPDYVSLLETRALLRLMGKRPALSAAVLGLDAIATHLIFQLCFTVTTLTYLSITFSEFFTTEGAVMGILLGWPT